MKASPPAPADAGDDEAHPAEAAAHHGLSAKIAPAFERIFKPLLDAQRGQRNRRFLGLGSPC